MRWALFYKADALILLRAIQELDRTINSEKVSMWVKWPPKSGAATRCFEGPFHPRMFWGARP
jgi:hypothetical protein